MLTGNRHATTTSSGLAGLLVAALITLGAGCGKKGPMLVPSPNLYVQMEEDPYAEVIPELQTSDFEMIYITDRVPETDPEGNLFYGYHRSRSIAVGMCTVNMGVDLPWEKLVSLSTTAKHSEPVPLDVSNITELVRMPDTPLPRAFVDGRVVDDPGALAAEQRCAHVVRSIVDRQLSRSPQKEILLFVHGYNNDFNAAVLRTAQLWHFLGRRGVPIVYTWPAGRGGLRGYTYDTESGHFTVHHLKRLLRGIAVKPEIERINIVAHSRGTDVITTAIRELAIEVRAAGNDPREVLKIHHLILAAADLDLEVTSQRVGAERVIEATRGFGLYLSEEDKALGMADWLFAGVRRIGQMTSKDLTASQLHSLDQLPDLEMIDVEVKTDAIGHAYFINSPAVLSDLILTIRYDYAPGAENGRPLEHVGGRFWLLKSGYPNAPVDDEAPATKGFR